MYCIHLHCLTPVHHFHNLNDGESDLTKMFSLYVSNLTNPAFAEIPGSNGTE